MSDRFQDIYRIPSARLRNWDYSADGIYFITICTASHEYYFGMIENKKMILSEIGSLVLMEWKKSFDMRVELLCDSFVIMPNHIHAILRIENGVFSNKQGSATNPTVTTSKSGVAYRSPKSISSFVAGFKSVITTKVRKNHQLFDWQTRFHDHIIHNEVEYQRIANYIETNPANWEQDKFYKK